MSHQRSSGNLLADRRYAYAEACLAEGHAAGAAEMAEQALEISSDYAPAWVLLGRARAATFAISGAEAERAAALEAFGRALALDPDDVLGSRLHLAGLGAVEAATAIGPAYVRALFEGYAPRFERHLVDELGYRGPQMMVDALDALPDAPRHFPRALDLGCGTGLMSRALEGRVGQLVGCDLSLAMLAQARRTGLYARLREADLVAFLAAEPPGSADLVTAADVFIYLGDLAPALRGIARVLAPGGLAILTVQSPEAGEGIVLGADGRYAHGDAHLRESARTAGLVIVAMQQAAIRRQKKIDVPGRVLILQKSLNVQDN
ncbi:putative TPR repeat methyltransferase [Methylorubrum rhodinum]|uniref:Putative TPR repeat methyltransferase n=1 Tax=Methylorubrum rhodinum TaxID=29428 RepID=A0A840ZN54_9HYPH|nr:methyltransferase domain-containing protein [Methylorubrum rhodinum]MBB5759642.1 putative TPR repeat methyltransferase [Methylorubrum rhodinum]